MKSKVLTVTIGRQLGLTAFPLWISTVLMTARHTDSGWVSGNQTVTEFDNVTLTCFSNLSKPAEWYFYRNDVTRGVPIYATAVIQPAWIETHAIAVGSGYYNLSIHNVSLDNGGKYECIENSGVGNYAPLTLYLNVKDVNECLESPCDKNAYCNNTISSFTCTCNEGFAGLGMKDTCHELRQLKYDYQSKLVGDVGLLTCETNQDASVIWLYLSFAGSYQVDLFRNGQAVLNNGFKVSADRARRQCGKCGSYNIKLHDLQGNFSGRYFCIEEEGYGVAHGIELNVTGLEELVYEPLSVSAGKRMTLGCQTSFKTPVVWFYARTSTSSRFKLFENESTNADAQQKFEHTVEPHDGRYDLKINHSQRNHTGLYVCVENNGMGKILRSYQLEVEDAAEPTPDLSVKSQFWQFVTAFTVSAVVVALMVVFLLVYSWRRHVQDKRLMNTYILVLYHFDLFRNEEFRKQLADGKIIREEDFHGIDKVGDVRDKELKIFSAMRRMPAEKWNRLLSLVKDFPCQPRHATAGSEGRYTTAMEMIESG